jgi:hypothetical protein
MLNIWVLMPATFDGNFFFGGLAGQQDFFPLTFGFCSSGMVDQSLRLRRPHPVI